MHDNARDQGTADHDGAHDNLSWCVLIPCLNEMQAINAVLSEVLELGACQAPWDPIAQRVWRLCAHPVDPRERIGSLARTIHE